MTSMIRIQNDIHVCVLIKIVFHASVGPTRPIQTNHTRIQIGCQFTNTPTWLPFGSNVVTTYVGGCRRVKAFRYHPFVDMLSFDKDVFAASPKKRAQMKYPWRADNAPSDDADEADHKEKRPRSPATTEDQRSKRVATLTHTPPHTSKNEKNPKQVMVPKDIRHTELCSNQHKHFLFVRIL